MLKEKGCYIILECGKELHELIHDFNGIDEIIERNLIERPNIEYDYEVPLLSLPLYFNTKVDNIPVKVPYLSALFGRAAQFILMTDPVLSGYNNFSPCFQSKGLIFTAYRKVFR